MSKIIIPPGYKPSFKLSELQDDHLVFIQTDYDLKFWLEFISLPKQYQEDITGCLVHIIEGDLFAGWLSEYSAYYQLSSIYHPIPYYLNNKLNRVYNKLPYYWQYDNPCYQNKGE